MQALVGSAVAVVPLPEAATASTAFDEDKSASWGVICPPTGAGADICDDNEDTSRTVQRGYTRHDHRYLIDTDAMYVNLTEDPTAAPWLEAASKQAVDGAGPENCSGNH
jgi:hypothetical protein